MKKEITAAMKVWPRTKKFAPAAINLSGPAGRRIVVSAVKRVIHEHRAVLEALAKR